MTITLKPESTGDLIKEIILYRSNGRGTQVFKLASLEKSDILDNAKYSMNFNIPHGQFSDYFVTSYLSDINNNDDIIMVEDTCYPTLSTTTGTSETNCFGMIQIQNKFLLLLPITKDCARLETSEFSIEFDSKTEVPYSRLLYLILESYEDKKPINVSAQLFKLSRESYRNKPKTVTRINELCNLISNVNLRYTVQKQSELYIRESGMLLGSEVANKDLFFIHKHISNRIQNSEFKINKVYEKGETVLFGGKTWISLISGNLGCYPGPLSNTWELVGSYTPHSLIKEVLIKSGEGVSLSVSGKVIYNPNIPLVINVTSKILVSEVVNQNGVTIPSTIVGSKVKIDSIPDGTTELLFKPDVETQNKLLLYFSIDGEITYADPDSDYTIQFSKSGVSTQDNHIYTYNRSITPFTITFNNADATYRLDKIMMGNQIVSQAIVPERPDPIISFCAFLEPIYYEVKVTSVLDHYPIIPQLIRSGEDCEIRVVSDHQPVVSGATAVITRDGGEYIITIENINQNYSITIS